MKAPSTVLVIVSVAAFFSLRLGHTPATPERASAEQPDADLPDADLPDGDVPDAEQPDSGPDAEPEP